MSSYPTPEGHFCTLESSDGEMCWEVPVLWEASKNLPVEEIDLRSLSEIQDPSHWLYFWKDTTHRWVRPELPKIHAADLSYPVILHPNGWLMDGCHRVAKALLSGATVIRAVRFTRKNLPAPWEG